MSVVDECKRKADASVKYLSTQRIRKLHELEWARFLFVGGKFGRHAPTVRSSLGHNFTPANNARSKEHGDATYCCCCFLRRMKTEIDDTTPSPDDCKEPWCAPGPLGKPLPGTWAGPFDELARRGRAGVSNPADEQQFVGDQAWADQVCVGSWMVRRLRRGLANCCADRRVDSRARRCNRSVSRCLITQSPTTTRYQVLQLAVGRPDVRIRIDDNAGDLECKKQNSAV